MLSPLFRGTGTPLWLGVFVLLVCWPIRVSAEFVDADLQLGAGYRQDQIDWNIAGTSRGTDPNILSELTWDDLEIYQVRAKGRMVTDLEGSLYFDPCVKGSIGYGWIVDGENRDSDYLGNDRTLEFSRSISKTEGDDVFDASLAIGPRFSIADRRLLVTPLVGWSYHEQNLNMTDGVQVLDPLNLFGLGPFPGLDSTYEAEWGGPWAGLDLEIRPIDRFTLSGSAEYHWVDYEAEADWNLRSDFEHPRSFEHEADGEGVVLSAAAALDLGNGWSVELSYDYQDWEAEDGTDRTFFADGSVGETRLNEVNWESEAVMLGVICRFF